MLDCYRQSNAVDRCRCEYLVNLDDGRRGLVIENDLAPSSFDPFDPFASFTTAGNFDCTIPSLTSFECEDERGEDTIETRNTYSTLHLVLNH